MTPEDRQVVEQLQALERKALANLSPPPPGPTTPLHLHYSELSPACSKDLSAAEWNAYLRMVGDLLKNGHAGKWVLIAGEELVGVWDTEDGALAARERFGVMFVKQVLEYERVYRVTRVFHPGVLKSWPS